MHRGAARPRSPHPRRQSCRRSSSTGGSEDTRVRFGTLTLGRGRQERRGAGHVVREAGRYHSVRRVRCPRTGRGSWRRHRRRRPCGPWLTRCDRPRRLPTVSERGGARQQARRRDECDEQYPTRRKHEPPPLNDPRSSHLLQTSRSPVKAEGSYAPASREAAARSVAIAAERASAESNRERSRRRSMSSTVSLRP